MIQEDLSECERIKLLLSKREPNQFGYVYQNAVNIFRDDVPLQQEIIPIIIAKVPTYTEDH